MPLSASAPRRRVHERNIECVGYEREDGLWDIEGHITDVKQYVHARPESGNPVEPGVPIHDMWLRLTIDMSFKIVSVEAVMDTGRFAVCPDIVPNFRKLEGLTIGRGFNKAVQEIVGTVHGCTHMRELVGRMATTALQATNRARQQNDGYNSEKRGKQLIGTCYAYASDSPVVLQRWPNLYTGKAPQPK
jgi:hypothetical protein